MHQKVEQRFKKKKAEHVFLEGEKFCTCALKLVHALDPI